MSTPVIKSPIQIPVLRVLLIGLIVIVLITRLVLIARSILDVILLPAQDPVRTDLIPVAQNPIVPLTVAIPVPSPPATSVQPVPTETLVPRASEIA